MQLPVRLLVCQTLFERKVQVSQSEVWGWLHVGARMTINPEKSRNASDISNKCFEYTYAQMCTFGNMYLHQLLIHLYLEWHHPATI